jgi:hypothetical protein
MNRKVGIFLLVALAGCMTQVKPPDTTTVYQRPATGAWAPGAQTATSGCHLFGADPDPACTPGALNPVVTQATIGSTICVPGWSSKARAAALPSSASSRLKRKVARYYSPPGIPATSEGDHLISIELGGDPAGGPGGNGANFFDEPHDLTAPDGQPGGSKVKDGYENHLHRLVCAGAITLTAAQHAIAVDWYGNYVAEGRPTG